jgi:hypothetical protein
LGAGPASAAEPFTYLYDAPQASSVPLSAQRLAEKEGWSELQEDDTTHRFEGCAVFLNDKIVAVLRNDVPDVDVYSRQTEGLKLCARLQPVCNEKGVRNLFCETPEAPLRKKVPDTFFETVITENTRSTVSLEVRFRSPGNQPCHVIYEMSVGAPFVKTTAGSGVEKLRVHAPCRFAVMPDFFGDDIVIDASTISVPEAELPSENFLLHMIDGGEAILMTVSESRDTDVRVALSETAPRKILSSDVSYGTKPHVWIAILADQGIWHEQVVSLGDAGSVIPLDWKMPFPALWRVDWSTVDKLTDSWEMLLEDPQGKYVMQGWFGQDESEGQRFGDEFGGRDWNKPGRKRWNPVLGQFAFPCWIDKDRQGYLQPLEKRRYTGRGEVYNFSGPVIVYPIDRVNRAPFHTPLEKLTVVDLVRMTLGVGPCQYILDLEGQKRNSPGVATCYARDVINAIYKEGTQLDNGPVIEEHLAAAVAFIRNVRERIDQYVEFGHEMSAYFEEQKRLHPQHAEFLDELLLVTSRLDQFFDESRERIHTPEYAQQTAESFCRNLLTYTGKDAYKKCDAQMRIFTSIGGPQDGLVASCRMIVKILRQRSGIAMAENPDLKDVATEIRTRTQAILRNPTAYEAPRH